MEVWNKRNEHNDLNVYPPWKESDMIMETFSTFNLLFEIDIKELKIVPLS